MPGRNVRFAVFRGARTDVFLFDFHFALEDSVGECAFWDFCHMSRCKAEASKVRDAGGAERGAVQPGIGADEVDGGGGQHVREMGLGLAAVGVRRSRVRRTAWEMVPSMPARMS